MKRFALLAILGILLAVDYFAADYFRPVKGWVMNTWKGKR